MYDVTKELWNEVHTYNVVKFWAIKKVAGIFFPLYVSRSGRCLDYVAHYSFCDYFVVCYCAF